MAYKKRQLSEEVEKAKKRQDGIRSINSNVDLGNGLTDKAYNAAIEKVIELTKTYNTLLSTVDKTLTELENSEKELASFSERMLSGIGTKYTFDSVEYEMAGGVRKSDRKRNGKKKDTVE